MRNRFIRLTAVFAALTLLGGCVSGAEIPSSATATTTTATTTTATATTTTVAKTEGKIEGVPLLCQYPEFPTGCEATAAVMALQYAGVDVTLTEFCADWLEKDSHFYYEGGKLHGPDPREIFAGTPTSNSSYGCYSPVISLAVRKNCDSVTVHNLSGWSVEGLCREYIDNGIPVVMWITMGLENVSDGQSWITESGETFTWKNNEHCALLIGYTETQLIFHDPMYSYVRTYNRAKVEDRYEQMERQALAFVPNE